MKKLSLLIIAFVMGAGCSGPEKRAGGGAPELVTWESNEGARRFARSREKIDFFPLSNYFEAQTNKVYCAPTSATIVLNALRVPRVRLEDSSMTKVPVDKSVLDEEERQFLKEGFEPSFKRYTQRSFFEGLPKNIKSKLEVLGKPGANGKRDIGFQLRHYHKALEAHGLRALLRVVDLQKASEGSFTSLTSPKDFSGRQMKLRKLIKPTKEKYFNAEQIRREIVGNLGRKGDFVLVNYKRAALGQKGGGHVSPLGAYDSKTDSVLIMDVNPNKAPWIWVKMDDLIQAMNTFDTVENRGYILVSEGMLEK